ncbi:MAG: YdcF family protein [Hyphomicrobiaceae bacterium]
MTTSTRIHKANPVGNGPKRGSISNRAMRVAITAIGVTLALLVFGFTLFAASVMREQPTIAGTADGIIVLTGGDFRILEGGRLLQQGHANRMLISGVNAKTSRDDLMKLSGLEPAMFDCCVDIGYAAQDTVGNAEEARTWAQGRNLSRLFVVTSIYHMPRSMAELALALPDADLIPDPVVPRKFRNRAWWLHPGAARILLSEYLKFLPVAARLGTMRYLKPWVSPTNPVGQPAASKS